MRLATGHFLISNPARETAFRRQGLAANLPGEASARISCKKAGRISRAGKFASCIFGPDCVSVLSPNSHVPVAACRSVGIRTRGRTAAGVEGPTPRPAVGGDRLTLVLHEWTRLEATTERAFLVSSRPSKGRVTEEACPSCRACGRGFLIRYVGYSKGFQNFGSRSRIGSRYGAPAGLSSTLRVADIPGAVSRLYQTPRLHRAGRGNQDRKRSLSKAFF